MAAPTTDQLKAFRSAVESVRDRAKPLFQGELEVGMHDIDQGFAYATKRASESFVYYLGLVTVGEPRKLLGLIPLGRDRRVRNLCWIYPVVLERDGKKFVHGQVNDAAVADIFAEEIARRAQQLGAGVDINRNF